MEKDILEQNEQLVTALEEAYQRIYQEQMPKEISEFISAILELAERSEKKP